MAAALSLPSVLPSHSWKGSGQAIATQRRPSNKNLIRASQAEGPLRRPSAPTTSQPPAPSIATSPPPPPSPSPFASSPVMAPSPSVTSSRTSVVTIEYQRQRAKELQEYFLDKKFEDQIRAGRIFGWTRKNEIANGRWTMFGIAVGLLTEYATGANFVEQLKIIVSNLGIADLD